MQVLYVDDEAPNRRVIGSILKRAGVAMAEADSAERGLWMIAAQDYDLILMDVRMPGMDGLSAIGEIRAHTDGKQAVPIIVVTADDAYDVRLRARAVGANAILVKPVTKEDLFEAMARAVAGWAGPQAA